MSDYSRGSVWRKWDLHLHSPSTTLNNQFEGQDDDEKWDKYLTDLAAVEEIAVLGITDYFSINGFLKMREHAGDPRLSKIAYVLPNTELRMIPVTGDRNPINIHVLFDPDIADELDRLFFRELEFEFRGDKYKCDREGLINLGRSFLGDNTIDVEAAYKEGVTQYKVDRNILSMALKTNKSLEGRYIVAVANKSTDGASGIQHSSLASTRQEIYRLADAIFSSNPNDREYFLGKGIDDEAKVRSQYRSLKPCIHGSDAHKNIDICRPTDNRFTWIKGDTTFEGLKQILYEPDLRVRIQEDNPASFEAYAKIGPLELSFDDDLSIKEDTSRDASVFCVNGAYNLALSNNLTCFIGGRGTGKSTFIHLIYNKIPNREVKRLIEVESPLMNLDISPNALTTIRESTECNIPTNTEFFFQNEIESSARNLDEMSALIDLRLFRLSKLESGSGLDAFRQIWEKSRDDYETIINSYYSSATLSETLDHLQATLLTLRRQTEVLESEDYNQLNQNIVEISNKLIEIDSYKGEVEDIRVAITELRGIIDGLEWSKEMGAEHLSALNDDLISRMKNIESAYTKYMAKAKKGNYEQQLAEAEHALKQYLEGKGLAAENVQELSEASAVINTTEEEIKRVLKEKQPFDKKYASKESATKEYRKAFEAYKQRYHEVISVFQNMLDDLVISDKDIGFELVGDYTDLKSAAFNFIRENALDDSSIRSDALERILFSERDLAKYIEDKQQIRRAIDEYEGAEINKSIIQQLFDDEIFLEKFHLLLAMKYFDIENVQVQTTLGGQLLRSTSFGERCGIVLAIIVAAGTNPIVIDQPEDNLDGRFISEVLVKLLRKQKGNRQIILVTRDANVVIGSDAEQILILETKDGRTSVLPCTIENNELREKYIWILDGGEEAFNTREKKYDIDELETL